jgi:hypothetical protein
MRADSRRAALVGLIECLIVQVQLARLRGRGGGNATAATANELDELADVLGVPLPPPIRAIYEDHRAEEPGFERRLGEMRCGPGRPVANSCRRNAKPGWRTGWRFGGTRWSSTAGM